MGTGPLCREAQWWDEAMGPVMPIPREANKAKKALQSMSCVSPASHETGCRIKWNGGRRVWKSQEWVHRAGKKSLGRRKEGT